MSSDSSAPLISCLSLIMWLVLMALGLSWISRHLLPRNPLLKRSVRGLLRLIFVSPFRGLSGTTQWFARAVRNTRPDYRRHQLFFNEFPVTPLALYAAIEETFAHRNIIGIAIERVSRLEWHLFSTRRAYVLVTYRDASCFISAVPLGTGLLVSWRYLATPSRAALILFETPYFGVLAESLLAPQTFYRADIYEALEQTIRTCITEATNALTRARGQEFPANENRPILLDFYN